MTNDDIKRILLANVQLDAEFYSSDKFKWRANGHHKGRAGHLLVQKATDARQGIVLYKPSEWLGLGRPLTSSERAKVCRVLKQIGFAGLITCFVDSRGRTTHVALTEAGKVIAQELIANAENERGGGL